MIVRKPYAFLIKHFKLIHFFILAFSLYLIYKSYGIFTFFYDYVETWQVISIGDLAGSYVPIILFMFSIFVIIFSIIIFILLKAKDKPKLLYVFMILYYIAFMIFCVYARGNIVDIQLNRVDPQSARIIRDSSLVFLVIQAIFVLFILIRTLGFDIRKFHFGEDLQELEVELSDSEEVEVTSGIDVDKLLRRYAMKKEDLKAFYYENKTILILIFIFGFLIIPGTFIIRNNFENKLYVEKELVDLEDFYLTINKSFITKYDYRGDKKFVDTKNSFVIIEFNLKNNGSSKRGINLDNLRLEVGENVYHTNTTYYNLFIDMGKGYYKQEIGSDISEDYIAIFVVDDADLSKDLIIRYTDKLTDNIIDTLYKRIVIKPEELDNVERTYNNNIKEILNFQDIVMKGSYFSIGKFDVKDDFVYESSEQKKYIINQYGKVLKLSYQFNVNENIDHISSFADLIAMYGTIIYTYNDKEYKEKIVNLTPKIYSEQDLFLAVDDKFANATNIKIVLKVRGANYIYNLK